MTDWNALVVSLVSLFTAVAGMVTALVGYARSRKRTTRVAATVKAVANTVKAVEVRTDEHGQMLRHLLNGQYSPEAN